MEALIYTGSVLLVDVMVVYGSVLLVDFMVVYGEDPRKLLLMREIWFMFGDEVRFVDVVMVVVWGLVMNWDFERLLFLFGIPAFFAI